jgi:hypothetical protein
MGKKLIILKLYFSAKFEVKVKEEVEEESEKFIY